MILCPTSDLKMYMQQETISLWACVTMTQCKVCQTLFTSSLFKMPSPDNFQMERWTTSRQWKPKDCGRTGTWDSLASNTAGSTIAQVSWVSVVCWHREAEWVGQPQVWWAILLPEGGSYLHAVVGLPAPTIGSDSLGRCSCARQGWWSDGGDLGEPQSALQPGGGTWLHWTQNRVWSKLVLGRNRHPCCEKQPRRGLYSNHNRTDGPNKAKL